MTAVPAGDDYLAYYDLERYLLERVHTRFHSAGVLDAFDFFSIIIWKANRAKSKIARRMLTKAPNLEDAAAALTRELASAAAGQERLRVLMDRWGFLLPMATAILSVLWPEVCPST